MGGNSENLCFFKEKGPGGKLRATEETLWNAFGDDRYFEEKKKKQTNKTEKLIV